MPISKKIPLKGTEHIMHPGTRAVGPIDPHELVEISLVLKNRKSLPALTGNTKNLSHDDFAREYGADASHVDKIRQFARENHLNVLERGDEIQRRTVTLTGTVAAMEKAFSVELTEFENPNGTYRSHTGPVQMPEEYASIVNGVFGLDNRVIAHPHIRYRSNSQAFGTRTTTTSYTPTQVARLYGFPQNEQATGQTIGLIELGGGFRPADITQYFTSLGLPVPTVKTVSVNHATNHPTTPQSADAEVMLDIEVAGAVAPGATIVVYFAPNTTRGYLDALSTAVHDQLRKPSVISTSWGSAEINWTAQAMENIDMVAQEAALLGISVTAASGDSGSSDGVSDGKNHVDFPASSPHILACGGTTLTTANGTTIQSETVWNDGAMGGATGGGFSTVFAIPQYQSKAEAQAFRGVPDVAGDADPETGYDVLIDGQKTVIGGTSAVAPLWAGLIAMLNQRLNKKLGLLNPTLYGLDQSNVMNDVTMGNNGAFTATFGWDACTGLGSPKATQLLAALPTAATVTTKSTIHA